MELKWVSVALAFLCGGVVVLFFGDDGYAAWQRYLDKYGRQLKLGFDFMFVAVDEPKARRILTGCVLGGFLVGFVSTLNILAGLLVAFFAFAIPLVIINLMMLRRIEIFDIQLLDIVNLMSNSLKSGLGLQQAMEMVVREMKAPASQEFALVLKEIQVGASTEDALIHLNERMKLPELDMIVTSIVTLRQTGGNLTETFDTISLVIKERRKVEGKIKALTAQGMMQAKILCGMPFVLAVILWIMDPTYIGVLFSTVLGWVLFILACILVVMGYVVIKKIVTIEV